MDEIIEQCCGNELIWVHILRRRGRQKLLVRVPECVDYILVDDRRRFPGQDPTIDYRVKTEEQIGGFIRIERVGCWIVVPECEIHRITPEGPCPRMHNGESKQCPRLAGEEVYDRTLYMRLTTYTHYRPGEEHPFWDINPKEREGAAAYQNYYDYYTRLLGPAKRIFPAE